MIEKIDKVEKVISLLASKAMLLTKRVTLPTEEGG